MNTPRSRLIVDSREQLPLQFRPGIFDEIVVKGMPWADYWLEVDGIEFPIMFERKGLGDLFGTMTNGYERFKVSMEKAAAMDSHMILLIEGSMEDVWKGYQYSQFDGESMLKKLAMLRVRHDLEYHFFNTRREMARFIEEIFSAVMRNWTKKNLSNISATEATSVVRPSASDGQGITPNRDE